MKKIKKIKDMIDLDNKTGYNSIEEFEDTLRQFLKSLEPNNKEINDPKIPLFEPMVKKGDK